MHQIKNFVISSLIKPKCLWLGLWPKDTNNTLKQQYRNEFWLKLEETNVIFGWEKGNKTKSKGWKEHIKNTLSVIPQGMRRKYMIKNADDDIVIERKR